MLLNYHRLLSHIKLYYMDQAAVSRVTVYHPYIVVIFQNKYVWFS